MSLSLTIVDKWEEAHFCLLGIPSYFKIPMDEPMVADEAMNHVTPIFCMFFGEASTLTNPRSH